MTTAEQWQEWRAISQRLYQQGYGRDDQPPWDDETARHWGLSTSGSRQANGPIDDEYWTDPDAPVATDFSWKKFALEKLRRDQAIAAGTCIPREVA